ncbi:putative FAD-dependent pyridine nucleotide-disulphide oxidoreductase [Klenkia taihuensis]|uniref:Thioredoxin reductase n=2 Tax=Klenkia taihuensis TaxID=1225127 RepID=A0A1I1NA93_9ACTN|nr:putative FAD-dependent pyridine nucleotide-disulphide oxidoreductase [Klenkia taihuensis]SFC94549.1 Thioredoxin reductase [Klenkia taihuensis]
MGRIVVGMDADVVVIGGGPAGLSGAKALARSLRSVVVVDDDRPRNAPADGAHNVLGHEGIAPRDLLAIGRRELEGYGGRVVDGRVVDARRTDGGFVVELADGGALTARRLLLAGGGVDELPDVPGLAQRWGRDVLHCPYCHGYEVRGQAIGVLATSPVSVHSTLMFSQLSPDVVLFAHGYSPTAEERATLDARGVQVVEGAVAGVEVTDDRLSGVRLASGEVVAREALVVTSFVRARTDHLAGLDLPVEELRMGDLVLGTKIVAEPTGRTPVTGVWAAGNAVEPMGQVVASMAAGLMAGAQLNMDLITNP